jgi:hypothetical protein
VFAAGVALREILEEPKPQPVYDHSAELHIKNLEYENRSIRSENQKLKDENDSLKKERESLRAIVVDGVIMTVGKRNERIS